MPVPVTCLPPPHRSGWMYVRGADLDAVPYTILVSMSLTAALPGREVFGELSDAGDTYRHSSIFGYRVAAVIGSDESRYLACWLVFSSCLR
jgi:hypothetical protein